MGISNAETCPGQAVFVVQRGAFQLFCAVWINENLGSHVLDDGIGGFGVVDFHDVLEARTTAFFDG